ncbi:hypothetical protein OQ699_19430 [Mycobacterium ulcerans]|nr:hypothetical protein [Mycobacterium ulcerans]MEB4232224.1 hypothetical protein [Mycobacterium ulcerans]
MYHRWCRAAIAVVFVLVSVETPALGRAAVGVTAYPGLEIHQGSVVCVIGFVEPQMRIALSAGRCNGDPMVTDRYGNAVGAVTLAGQATVSEVAVDGAAAGVDYEVITLAPEVAATDLLPTGLRLQSKPGFRVQPGARVCEATAARQRCGRVDTVTESRFVIAGMDADQHEIGAPVYVLDDDNHALIAGLLDGVRGSISEAQSWPAVMRQVYLDSRSVDSTQPPPQGRTIGS